MIAIINVMALLRCFFFAHATVSNVHVNSFKMSGCCTPITGGKSEAYLTIHVRSMYIYTHLDGVSYFIVRCSFASDRAILERRGLERHYNMEQVSMLLYWITVGLWCMRARRSFVEGVTEGTSGVVAPLAFMSNYIGYQCGSQVRMIVLSTLYAWRLTVYSPLSFVEPC